MRARELGLGALRAWSLALLMTSACASSREVGEGVGGESHFLRHCDAPCGSGLDCIQGLCTRGCVVGKDSCGDLFASAQCTADSVEPGEVAVCDLACARDADCVALSASHRCESGFCRVPEPAGAGSDAGAPAGDAGVGALPYPTRRLTQCGLDVGSGPTVKPLRAVIQADTLTLTLRNGDGCAQQFEVCFVDGWDESYPVQVTLYVLSDNQIDACRFAARAEEYRFDLTPLADTYARLYQQSAGLIATSFGLYAFGALSCEERVLGARGQAEDYERAVSRACESADDCTWTSNSTRCTAGCGVATSIDGAAELSERLAVTSASVCGDYEAEGCGPVLIPPCAPPRPLACVDYLCQEQ